MASTAKKQSTYDDLKALPEALRAELIGGAIVAMPSVLPRHSKAAGAVRRFIGGPYDDDDGHGGPGGWWIFQGVDVRMGAHDVVRPDVAGWRRVRPQDHGEVRPIDVVPDWICEVLSPSNAAQDRVKKRRLYALTGVAYYWLLDPGERTLEALELHDGAWVELGAYDDSAVARIPPFADIELDVGRSFLPRA